MLLCTAVPIRVPSLESLMSTLFIYSLAHGDDHVLTYHLLTKHELSNPCLFSLTGTSPIRVPRCMGKEGGSTPSASSRRQNISDHFATVHIPKYDSFKQ